MCLTPAWVCASGATVDFATGGVDVVATSGAARPLAKGGKIDSGDTVRTAPDGRVQLRFSDGAMVSLQPDTQFAVDEYRFNTANPEDSKGFFSLLKGGLRTITGLVGRTNKNAYKVTTSVATIGIRGTEFTIAYNGTNGISVATGEGAIEICNNAGCAIVPAGASAVVGGPTSTIQRTEIRPRLDPVQPTASQQAVFSTSETRTSTGTLLPVSAPLPSGAGYSMAYAGMMNTDGMLPENDKASGGTATFDSNSVLQKYVDSSSNTFAGTNIAGGFTLDGVIGWGRWTAGSHTSYDPLQQFHYVVGVPTPGGDMSALTAGGVTATYSLAGFTLPTSASGVVGGAPSGTLTANFSAMTVAVNLSVPINGGTLTLSDSGGTISGSTFSYNSGCCYQGFFAGANASHAGLAYKIHGSSVGLNEYVFGAAAFKK